MTTVKLVYDKDCPNASQSRANLARALAASSLEPRWIEWERSAPGAPGHVRGFPSPTVLVNGRDVAGFQPAGGLASCRIYRSADGRLTGVPPVEIIARALVQARPAWKQSLLVLAGAAFGSLPQLACPACWPAYAGLLSSLGLGFLLSNQYLLPLTIAFLALAIGALGLRAWKSRRYGTLLLGLAGSALLVAGKFVLGSNTAMYGGVSLLVAASLWNARPQPAAAHSNCPVCEVKTS
ncbi:MAG: hypothetical protein HY236_04045 [Acidobacteria bacterium]|nr:hypothetical protein [Acidobacteriota bacterium]